MFTYVENGDVIITMDDYEACLTAEKPSDVIVLYSFYKRTGIHRTADVAKIMKWSESRARRAKKELVNLGLVDGTQQKS